MQLKSTRAGFFFLNELQVKSLPKSTRVCEVFMRNVISPLTSCLSLLYCPLPSVSLSSLKKANIGFEQMFEEVPIVIKNSHIISVLMWELEDKSTVADKHELLNLSSRSDMSSCIHLPQGPRAKHPGCKTEKKSQIRYLWLQGFYLKMQTRFFRMGLWRVINICSLTFTAILLFTRACSAVNRERFGFLPNVAYKNPRFKSLLLFKFQGLYRTLQCKWKDLWDIITVGCFSIFHLNGSIRSSPFSVVCLIILCVKSTVRGKVVIDGNSFSTTIQLGARLYGVALDSFGHSHHSTLDTYLVKNVCSS